MLHPAMSSILYVFGDMPIDGGHFEAGAGGSGRLLPSRLSALGSGSAGSALGFGAIGESREAGRGLPLARRRADEMRRPVRPFVAGSVWPEQSSPGGSKQECVRFVGEGGEASSSPEF